MVLHPSVRLLLGLSLVVLSSALDVSLLLFFVAALLIGSWARRDVMALRWLRRARYLLIVPPLVCGYAIAGTGVLPWDIWSPTWEGLHAGVAQSLKLLVALLALRIALWKLTSAEMTRGLIGLFAPLQHIGIDTDRVAYRLQLTLHYLEELDGKTARQLLSGVRPTHQ